MLEYSHTFLTIIELSITVKSQKRFRIISLGKEFAPKQSLNPTYGFAKSKMPYTYVILMKPDQKRTASCHDSTTHLLKFLARFGALETDRMVVAF